MNLDLNTLSGYTYILVAVVIIVLGTCLVIGFSHIFAKYFLITIINKTAGKRTQGTVQLLYKNHVFHRIAYLIPGLILYSCSGFFRVHTPHLRLDFSYPIMVTTSMYCIIVTSLIATALLNCVNDYYSGLSISKQKPIKSYIQVIKIIIFMISAVFIASILFEVTPTYFFTSVGALTAIVLLIFKDSILGFVASIQLAAYDMVRIGDWIELPSYGADGEVTDISLNTVKVQNFDNSFVTIPSYALLTSGLKNWRGMKEAGGRRVKRAINIDVKTIKMCDAALIEHLRQANLFKCDTEQVTNIGAFRWFVVSYLQKHSSIHKKMKILIRQLQGNTEGLPLEVYFYIAETDSIKYEIIQADIFDYFYAILPEFGLRAFQHAG